MDAAALLWRVSDRTLALVVLMMLVQMTPAPNPVACIGGGTFPQGCAPADYTICGGCHPTVTNVSACVMQRDATGDRVCAVLSASTGSLSCVGCNAITDIERCSSSLALNCRWTGSACEFINMTTATAPTTDGSGNSCGGGATAPGPAVVGPSSAPSGAALPYDGTFPPTASSLPPPPNPFTIVPDRPALLQWSQVAATFRVLSGASELMLTLSRRPSPSADNNNVAYFDNVSAVFSDCDSGSQCSALLNRNVVVGGNGVASTPPAWDVEPSALASYGAVLGQDHVFEVGLRRGVPRTMSQRITVPHGSIAVTIFMQVYNTASDVDWNGLLTGRWFFDTVATPLNFSVGARGGAPQAWIRLEEVVTVPRGAQALNLTLGRQVVPGVSDNGNTVYWDNVSVMYTGCDGGSACSLVAADNFVADGDASPSDNWRAHPTGNSQIAVFNANRVFALSANPAQHPHALSQRVPVPLGAREATVIAQVFNTLGNTNTSGSGIVLGRWQIPTTTPSPTAQPQTSAPTTVPTPSTATQFFSVSADGNGLQPGQWHALSITVPVFSNAVSLRVKLARSFINGQVEVGNVVYFTNVSVVFACLPSTQTPCSQTVGRGTNVLINGNASSTQLQTWTSFPVNFVIRSVGVAPPEQAFALANDSQGLFPHFMHQVVQKPGGAYAVTVSAMVYNTVANAGIQGYGYVHGSWLTQRPSSSSAAPTTQTPSTDHPTAAPLTAAPTAAPSFNRLSCASGHRPHVSGVSPSLGANGTQVTVHGAFRSNQNMRAKCFWWYEGMPYASYRPATLLPTDNTAVSCVAPEAPTLGALVNISIVVWDIRSTDTRFTSACMSHLGPNIGATAEFQYVPILSPTSAGPTTAPPPPDFFSTSQVPAGSGSCSACVSCNASSDPGCVSTLLFDVQCPNQTAAVGGPPAAPLCECPELFQGAGVPSPGLLPRFPATPCGSMAAVPCYQRGQRGIGRGFVKLDCAGNGSWTFSSWDASSCVRTSLSDLVQERSEVDSNGVRVAVSEPNPNANLSDVSDAMSNMLLVGSRDVVMISDYLAALVNSSLAPSLSCREGADLVALVWKLMLAVDLAERRASGAAYVAELQLNVLVASRPTSVVEVTSALTSAVDSLTQQLLRSDRNTTQVPLLNWGVVCQDAGNSGLCPGADAAQNFSCSLRTSWTGSDSDLEVRTFWQRFQTFYNDATLSVAVSREIYRGRAIIHVERAVAVRRFSPIVESIGPFLAEIAPQLLSPGDTFSLRGRNNGFLLSVASCDSLVAATERIQLDFGSAAFVSPTGCGTALSLENLNVSTDPDEILILGALGYLNATYPDDDGGNDSASSGQALPSLDEVNIAPLTLQRLYGCSSGAPNGTQERGQSITIYPATDFLLLVNRTRQSRQRGDDTDVDVLNTSVVLHGSVRVEYVLSSRVLSLSLGGQDVFPSSVVLDPPVLLTFTNLAAGRNHTCAFYSFDDEAFRTDGMAVVNVSADGTTVVCSTSHTTNFAVLTSTDGSVNGQNSVSEDDSRALTVMMYIGLAVSLVCYAAILATYLLHRELLSLGKVVLCHICGTLAIGQTAFVMGVIVATEDSPSAGLCTTLGVLAHYFLLSAFGWMLCEASFIHMNFTSVFAAFTRNESHTVKWYVFWGYGTPLVVVAATLGVLPDAYDNHDVADGQHCFLTSDDGAIWAFVGPMLLIIVANTIMLTRVVIVVTNASVRKLSGMSPEDEKRHKTHVRTKRALYSSASFFFLLGIGWIFGVFAFGDASLIFQYIFSIILVAQGLCLFYFHCYSDAEASAAWRRSRRKRSLSSQGVRGKRPPRQSNWATGTSGTSSSESNSVTDVFGKPASKMMVSPYGSKTGTTQSATSNASGGRSDAYLVVQGSERQNGSLRDSPIGAETRASEDPLVPSIGDHLEEPSSFGSETSMDHRKASTGSHGMLDL